MSKAELPPRRPGRPPSAAARTAILSAARVLLDEVGPTRLTMEGVARRAGVGKPTVYRHFANAQELAMAALAGPERRSDRADGRGFAAIAPLIDTLVARLSSRRGRQMALMLAGAEPDSEIFKAFANSIMLETRRAVRSALNEAAADGGIAAEVDRALLADMLLGAVFMRLLLRHAPLDDALAGGAVALARRLGTQ